MTLRRAALLAAGGTLLLALRSSAGSAPEAARLADALRALYAAPPEAVERWRGPRRQVTLADGRTVPRDVAYRDRPLFMAAAEALLSSPAADDAPLGAWLLGTAPPSQDAQVRPVLQRALFHPDPRAAFEAARILAEAGDASSREALARAAREAVSADVRSAAAWAEEQIAQRAGAGAPPRARSQRVRPGFQKGVCWWRSEAGADAGASSFRRLRALGVDWVSIHTWDPLQKSIHDPEFAKPRRLGGLPELKAIVASAHAAGLRVMIKPHLEMSGYLPSDAERHVLRGPDGPARRALVERIEARRAAAGWHNLIEMKSEEDWARWFASYEAYLIAYARQARAAGADAFSVGRELDRSAVLRERDWRRLIARVRTAFPGPLTYSANFDSYGGIRFWDALDAIGISAYFPLSARPDPGLDDLAAGWAAVLPALEAVSRRFDRPVLFTEIGYPSAPTAAQAPWGEFPGPADTLLQARCAEAALRAVADRPWIAGVHWWLWEGVGRPPFRDTSYTIHGKPAAFTLARWFRGLGGVPRP